MDDTKFFVMLRNQDGYPIVLVDENENIALFSSFWKAKKAAEDNLLGEAYGYVIHDWTFFCGMR